MSRVEVYRIAEDGTVHRYAEERNAHACLPHAWRCLAKKYGVPDPFDYSRKDDGLANRGTNEPLWDLLGKGAMTEDDEIVLGFTFDASWFAKADVPRLVEALERFWEANKMVPKFWDRGVVQVDDTIPRLCAVLRRLVADPDCRGACFNQTAVNSNPWRFVEGDDEERAFVFGKDERDANGAEPFEVMKRLSAAYRRA